MVKTVSAFEARRNFGELLNLVYYKDMEIIVEKMGKPFARITKVSDTDTTETRKEIIAKYAGIWKNDPDIEKIEAAMKDFRKNFKLTRS